MLLFKRIYVISFILFWIYVIYYPFVMKVFNLKTNYKPNIDTTCAQIMFSSMPILNTATLIYFVYDDIQIYKRNKYR